MNVLITGATGLVGNKLVALLHKDNHVIHYLSTSKSKLKNNPNYKGFYWNPSTGEIDTKAFEDVSVIIHLAGASISKKWTKAYKKEIIESRVKGANLIFETLKSIPNIVERFISASAVGIYPNDLNYVYHENNAQIDESFLGEVTQLWEESANQFKSLSISVSIVRIGVVFAKESGALVEMTKPIKYGFGAVLASGQQYVSWIHIDDLVGVFKYIFDNESQIKNTLNDIIPKYKKKAGIAVGELRNLK